jgi:hypothetical protein
MPFRFAPAATRSIPSIYSLSPLRGEGRGEGSSLDRAGTINPPTKEEFDAFWEKQDSSR